MPKAKVLVPNIAAKILAEHRRNVILWLPLSYRLVVAYGCCYN